METVWFYIFWEYVELLKKKNYLTICLEISVDVKCGILILVAKYKDVYPASSKCTLLWGKAENCGFRWDNWDRPLLHRIHPVLKSGPVY